MALVLVARNTRRLNASLRWIDQDCATGDCAPAGPDASVGTSIETGEDWGGSAAGAAPAALFQGTAPPEATAVARRIASDSTDPVLSSGFRSPDAGMVMVAPRAAAVEGSSLSATSGPEAGMLGVGSTDGAATAVESGPVDAVVARGSDSGRGESTRETGPRALCGSVACAPGDVCCNRSCGICTPPGGTCSQQVCGLESLPISVSCGPNTCNVGQVCCNASCGICASPGATCDQRPCESPKVPFSVSCGMNTCNVGEVCCNASCGICALPGQTCRTDPCP